MENSLVRIRSKNKKKKEMYTQRGDVSRKRKLASRKRKTKTQIRKRTTKTRKRRQENTGKFGQLT